MRIIKDVYSIGRKSEVFLTFLILLDIGLIVLIVLNLTRVIDILKIDATLALFAPLFFCLFGTIILIIRIVQKTKIMRKLKKEET